MVVIHELLANPSLMIEWPPLYSGIWFSHILAWPFMAVGIDLSKAMLLVFDAALVSLLSSGIWVTKGTHFESWKKYVFFFALILIAPLGMATLALQGFYAQAISIGFYAPFLALWIRSGFKTSKSFLVAVPLLGLGAWTYPDSFMWLAPLLLQGSLRSDNLLFLRRLVAVLVCVGVVALFKGQLHVMPNDGGGGRGYSSVFQGLLFLAVLCWFSCRKTATATDRRIRDATLMYCGISLALTIYSSQTYGEVLYYARKNYYSAFYFLPILVFYFLTRPIGPQRRWSGLSLMGFIWIALGFTDFLRRPIPELVDHIVRARGSISLADRVFVSEAKTSKSCPVGESLMIFPPEPNRAAHLNLGSRISRLIYSNLGTVKFDLRTYTLCWFGTYTGYIDAGLQWEDRISELSGNSLCVPSCKTRHQ
jgi:hypothetical protein